MSTSISDLPMDPAGGSSGNVAITASVPNAPQQPGPPVSTQDTAPLPPPENVVVDQSSISNLVTGLQQATATGATQLASRDIPTTSQHILHDEHVTPNFVPQAETRDYIDTEEDEDMILNAYNKQTSQQDSTAELYSEFQTPFMLGILFFLFQLPFFKKYMFLYLPSLFLSDGNYNIYGFLTISTLFAFVYYTLSKSILLFNRF